MTTTRRYRAIFPFGGAGGGALGFSRAKARVLDVDGEFEIVGSLDSDSGASDDFEMFTGAPALRKRVEETTPAELRAAWGEQAPDIVFLSPPCKGASGLLQESLAATPKYQAMNDLALAWMRLMLEAWKETQPRFVLLENVPLLKSRAAKMLTECRRLLRSRGYAVSEGYHDCGELGGLAQRRRRYLMVARDQKRAPYPLYQPIRRRVRACGEVLGKLHMPDDPLGGPMHALPLISWVNLVRLALIPAGGDWRDLPGVVPEGAERRSIFKRHAVEDWQKPTGTIGGTGSNGVENVADPRVGHLIPQAGNSGMHLGKYQVRDWGEPLGTVTAATRIGSGAQSVADPRASQAAFTWGGGRLGVKGWQEPAATITGDARPSKGAFSVADPRLALEHDPDRKDHYFRVLRWSEPSFAIATKIHPGCGAYTVADPRLGCAPRAGAYGVLRWDEAARTITGSANIDNGAFAIADPRLPDAGPVAFVDKIERAPFVMGGKDGKKRISTYVVIIAEDGTWHRPLTTLELAVLQGFPAEWKGKPLKLSGPLIGAWHERIGNAVPPPTAEAIAVRFLVTLLQCDAGTFRLSEAGTVWVGPPPVLPDHLEVVPQ